MDESCSDLINKSHCLSAEASHLRFSSNLQHQCKVPFFGHGQATAQLTFLKCKSADTSAQTYLTMLGTHHRLIPMPGLVISPRTGKVFRPSCCRLNCRIAHRHRLLMPCCLTKYHKLQTRGTHAVCKVAIVSNGSLAAGGEKDFDVAMQLQSCIDVLAMANGEQRGLALQQGMTGLLKLAGLPRVHLPF